jgi:hypothetical protein
MLNNSVVLYNLVNGLPLARPCKVNAYSFFIKLAQNRLLFWFLKKYQGQYDGEVGRFMEDGYQLGCTINRETEKTMDVISSIHESTGLDYIIAKGDRDIPYINCDIDLLVKENDYSTWLMKFKENHFSIEGHKTFMCEHDDQNIVRKQGHKKVDITVNFDWQDGTYFDQSFLWDGFDGKSHRQRYEANMLVNIGSVLFKRMSLNLIDYLYFKDRIKNLIPNKEVNNQTTKFNWSNSFEQFLQFINSIDPEKDPFPILFPARLVKDIFMEKLFHKSISLNYWSYFTLARIRYYLLNKRYVPFHVFWIPLKSFDVLQKLNMTLENH